MYNTKDILKAPSAGVQGGRLILTEGTHYIPFVIDSYSAKYGFHVLIVGGKGGAGTTSVAIQEAVSTEQETWQEIEADTTFGTSQATIEDSQLVISLGTPATIYKPIGRLCVTVPAGDVAVFHKVLVTGGTD